MEISMKELSRCLNSLVSVEKFDDVVYQGRIVDVLESIPAVVLERPFKDGEPMSEEKFAVNISGKDVMRVVEPASSSTPQQATTSTKKPTASAKKPTASTKKPAAATQKPIPTVKSANAMNGTRIDVNALLSASAANPQASASTTQPIFANKESTEKVKVYGDFKQFTEKLQPKPLQLAGKEMFQQMQQRNDRQAFNFNGPSGNPIVDSSNGYQKTYGNHVLNKPLDLNELREDFDFSGNLALFRKDGSECEDADNECDMGPGTENDPANYFNVVYEDKTAPNYRNDENVIKDPKRVLSWVKGTSGYIPQQQIPTAAIKKQQKAVVPFVPPVSAPVQFPPIPAPIPLSNVVDANFSVDEFSSIKLQASKVLPTDNGSTLPVLKFQDKQTLLAAAIRLYNEQMYNCIVADRFADYVFDIQKRHSMKSRGMVIIAGRSCDPVLLHRFAQFFVNRGLKLYIYDPPQVPGSLLSKVTIVHNVNKFSVNVTAAFMLCARTFHEDEELRNWVLRSARPNPPNPFTVTLQSSAEAAAKQTYLRLIALDFRLFDVKHMHTLYLGAADESAIGAGRPHPRFGDPLTTQCTFEAVVADIGTPFSWIDCVDAAPIEAFRNSLTCRLVVPAITSM